MGKKDRNKQSQQSGSTETNREARKRRRELNKPKPWLTPRAIAIMGTLVVAIVSVLAGYFYYKNQNSAFSRNVIVKMDLRNFEDWQLDQLKATAKLAVELGLPNEKVQSILEYNRGFCYTKECLETVMETVSLINFTANPCTDWLSFACSTSQWVNPDSVSDVIRKMTKDRTKSILVKNFDDKPDVHNYLLKEAQTYFYQCYNKELNDGDDMGNIFEFLDATYGGTPLTTGNDHDFKFNWLDMVADLNQIEGIVHPFLQVSVSEEPSACLKLTAGIKWNWNIEDFANRVSRIHEGWDPWDRKTIEKEYQKISKFVEAFNNAVNSSPPNFQILTLENIQRKTDDRKFKTKVNWLPFLARSLKGSGIDLDPETTKIEINFEAVMDAFRIIENGELKTVSNILHFELEVFLLQETTSLFDDLDKMDKETKYRLREETCFNRATKVFGYSLGKTYLSIYYDEKRTPSLKAILNNIITTYIAVIQSIPWMKDSTRDHLQEKLEGLKYVLVEPELTKNPELLKEFYQYLKVSTNKSSSYVQNHLNVARWTLSKERNYKYRLLHKTEQELYGCDPWGQSMISVDACVKPRWLHAVFPIGFLNGFVHDVTRPGYLNYGGLGQMIAHELAHLFDTEGRLWNSNGQQGEFWDSETLNHYNQWLESLQEDYQEALNQAVENVKTKDGESLSLPYTSINQDMADNLGLLISYATYKQFQIKFEAQGKVDLKLPILNKLFTPDQLFFIKYANNYCDRKILTEDHVKDVNSKGHTLGDIRAVVPVQRSKFFADAFNCEPPKSSFSDLLHKV